MTIQRYTYHTTVSYSDVAPDGKMSFGGLLRILQETACIASDLCGFGIKDIPTKGLHWILMGWRAEFFHRPGWNEPISVETWPRTMEGFASDRDFLVYAGDTPVARATSRWYLLSAVTGKLTRVTDDVRACYPIEEETVFDEPLPGNGKSLPQAEETFSTPVCRRDIDTNSHVNNLRYLDYALEALPQTVYDDLPNRVEIIYRKQILPGTTVHCLYGLTEEGVHQVEICSGEGDKPTRHAYVRFY